MSRDLTGLMTHENTGVAGYSAAAVVDARGVESSTIDLPRCGAVESQKPVQVPVTPLYCACIFGKGQGSSNSHCNNAGRVAGRFFPEFV